MKDVAVVGLPSSGKSTVFTAVTRHAAHPGSHQATMAVLSVPDPRVERLRDLYGSAEAAHARLRLVDVPGFDAHALGEARVAHALAVVLRCFGPDPGPARDLASFRAELAVADLQTVERVRERAGKRAKAGERAAQAELDVCDRAEAVLSQDRWLSEESWPPDDRHVIDLWTPLTTKPVLHVLNADEAGADPGGLPEPVVVVRGLLEAETAELEPDEAAALLHEYGLDEPAAGRFVRAAYDAMGLVTFFTANEHEAHAWAVVAGTRAPQAAGAVHTDFEKGFIRAERVAFDELDEAGSADAAKHKGLVRLEGKEYVVREGDVLFIRHS
ncbi:MAG: DUF933 domain-containing protein [Candidatus Binatia bacterium]